MTSSIFAEKILILDFGSQYTQLIARRVRELGVYCEILPYDVTPEEILAFRAKGLILSGGPESVTVDDAPKIPDVVFSLGVPVLGICYGMQAMAQQLGGEVSSSSLREFGFAEVDVLSESLLFDMKIDSVGSHLKVWMSHGDKVTALPVGFRTVARSTHAPICVMADDARRWYGIQFHPEVTHTEKGGEILDRFIRVLCGCLGLWRPLEIIDELVQQVRVRVGQEKVLLALSGGVDSSVLAALLHRAIGDQLICVFVDNGLLRKGEKEQVVATFSEGLGIQLIVVDAASLFLDRLKEIEDPEQKRKIIGKAFIDVFEKKAAELAGVTWLAQGTIYPDVIESAGSRTGKAHVIKSHHNVGGLPERMNLKLLEPLRELFKDEVRKIGVALGLPDAIVYRHPFPGPGLAVRVLGKIEASFLQILREADAIYMEELHASGWYAKTSQAFAVFLPVKSVGVVGDARQYEYVVSLRAVETIDFMTAKYSHLPYELLERISSRIVNEVKGISRVVYDISSKPPATIEWE